MRLKYKTQLVNIISIITIILVCSSFVTQQPPSGKELFEKHCIKCHGAEGTKHVMGAKSLQKSKIDDAAIIHMIQNGKFFMPSYKKKLSADEINQLTGYVKTLRK